MKKVILVFVVIFTVATARAQYVSIPDADFGTWLDANGFSSCMTGNANTGWQLDTTCSAVLSATSMHLENFPAAYLQGLQYFKNVTFLNITNMQNVSSFPALPPALTYLYLNDDGQIPSLPPLPPTLKNLYGSDIQQVSSLPALPEGLLYLDWPGGNLNTLPPLPPALIYLSCPDNHIQNMPALPQTLTYLNCSGNMLPGLPAFPPVLDTLICSADFTLSSLPALPNSLIYLDCWGNHSITTLPELPPSLTYLACGEDDLTSMPFLPSTLTYLSCFDTHLISLPGLPTGLSYLDCSSNSLVFIPPLPTLLAWFDCSNNPDLTCLPHLNGIVHFNFTNTAISCLPNLPTSNTYTNPTVPVCTGNAPCTAGINQLADEHFTVYPNPASNHLTVENSSGIKLLRLSNMLGQTVYTTTGNSELTMSIDVTGLPTGIYIVEAHNAYGINTAKVVVGD